MQSSGVNMDRRKFIMRWHRRLAKTLPVVRVTIGRDAQSDRPEACSTPKEIRDRGAAGKTKREFVICYARGIIDCGDCACWGTI